MALRFSNSQISFTWAATADMGEVRLIGRAANIGYFIDTTGATDVTLCGGGASDQEQNVAGHQRLTFPGQTEGITEVSATTRKVMQDPGRRHGNALPGQSIVLANNEQRRQITLAVGDIVDAAALFKTTAKVQFWFYAQSGARYCIPAAPNDG